MYLAIESAFPRSGIISVIKSEMRDGPGISDVEGILSLYHYMGTSRTSLLAEQLFRGTPFGFSIKVGIEDLTLDSGRYGTLWLIPFTIIKKYIGTNSWVFAVIEYNHRHNITIYAKHKTLEAQRTGDKTIMTTAAKYYKDTAELKLVNRVRQGNKYIRLSNIYLADSKHIDKRYTLNNPCEAIRNEFEWTDKSRITKVDYRIWRIFLEKLCGDKNLVLTQPLGKWNPHTYPDWLASWDWFVTPDTETIYHQYTRNKWCYHQRKDNRHY